MRYAALILTFALWSAGCGKVEKEIDTPGPAPPYDPKAAALPANVTPDKPQDIPLESPWNPPKDGREKEIEADEAEEGKAVKEPVSDADAAPEKDSE
jgi:hypothetical protein